MSAPFRSSANLSTPHKNVHFETDSNFLWRIRGHWSDTILKAPPYAGVPYRAATKADVTT